MNESKPISRHKDEDGSDRMQVTTEVLQDLEFNRVLQQLSEMAMSPSTVDRLKCEGFSTDVLEVRKRLKQVEEYIKLEDLKISPRLVAFTSLEDTLVSLRPVDSVLQLEEVLNIRDILVMYEEVLGIRAKDDIEEHTPELLNLLGDVPNLDHLILRINEIIDEEGQVRDDASEELVQIRRKSRKLQATISTAFNKALKQFSSLLIDSQESLRNGRRVLAVKSENKRQVRGLIHDESATGKTTFIEPEDVIILNQQVFELEVEEKKEIYKIIRDLCSVLRTEIEAIKWAEEVVIQIDVIRTKANFSRKIGGVRPEVEPYPNLGWKEVRHPLLYLKNLNLGLKTVPSDMVLHGRNRIVLISGPNAGGKSVTLKTCGLLQLMLQYGLLVPCDPDSKAGIFTNIIVDIGDQQSIDNDLSTYSSHLQKMVKMMEEADSSTLILIDEFGSGTDPAAGGALAEAILSDFLQKKCFGVITTHYSNLKVFAFRQNGIVNAAMNFDKKALTPTYQLTIGKPGSSFAFEIAQKMKVPGPVIKRAKKRMGSKQVKVEDLLVSIQQEKNQLEKQLSDLKEREDQLDRLVKTYSDLQKDLDYRRKRLKLEAKEQKLSLASEYNKKLESTIRELAEAKKLEEVKAVAQEEKGFREQLSQEVHDLQEEIIDMEKTSTEPIKVGDFVRMRNGDVTGEVENVLGADAIVVFGGMRMTVPVKDLKSANEPIPVRSRHGIYTEVQNRTTKFKPRIDIRGLKFNDALTLLETYLDEAVVVGVPEVKILHGKGSGALRKAVREKAKEYRQITSVTHPDADEGGEGISILHLA
jgi:DNA mismatch repair protein MutS2